MKTFSTHSWNILLVPALILFLFSACSDLRDDLPSASVSTISVHPAGWTTVSSSDFHGQTIRKQNWDMRNCKTCHGPDYSGGSVRVTCRKCHQNPAGPEDCTTCHGSTNPAPPRDLGGNTAATARGVGAHQTHVAGSFAASNVACNECHEIPSIVYTPGHLDSPSPAEVLFDGPLAKKVTNIPGGFFYSATMPQVIPSPSYDAQALKCSNTYCHGTFKNGNPSFAPVWNDAGGAQAACGTCHGDVSKSTLAERALPRTSARGGTHPEFLFCEACHGDVVDANLNIINPSKHINGKLNLFQQERDY